MKEFFSQPWPWYIGGPLIGLMVPALLLLGNKSFGISSSLRHICAAVIPSGISFFKYDWKKEKWNLFFAAGILAGAFIAGFIFGNAKPVAINPETIHYLQKFGIQDFKGLLPRDLFNWSNLFTIKGFVFMIAGGFFVGFGTRYAGGCTSGHSIMGLSNLQWPSLVATICFMIGGFISAWFIVPFFLSL